MRVHLRRRLALEVQVAVPDGAGGLVSSWALVGHLWAEVSPGVGRAAGGEEFPVARQPFRITVRGAPPGAASRPVAGQRFRDGSRVFLIEAVTERDPVGRYLVCAAVEEEPA